MTEKDNLNPDEMELDLSERDVTDEMDSMVFNLEEIDEDAPDYEAMPPGIYNCVVENTEHGPSSKGNPMITWVFKVIDPQYENRLLFYHTTLNNNRGLRSLKRLLTRVVPDIDMKAFKASDFCDNGVAIGHPCRVKIKIKPYQGKKRNEVTDVLAPGEAGGSFLDDE